jgi:hypothetical protein
MHGGTVVDDTATESNLVTNIANARPKINFPLQNKLYGFVLAAADEAADLLDAATAHIEVIYSHKHVARLQLAGSLRGLIWNKVIDVQILIIANFKHDAHACEG